MAPRNGETAARLRAARGYKGLTQAQLAQRLGISVETLSRMENGKGPVSDRRRDEVGELCEVPPEFMLSGFASLEQPVSDIQRQVYMVREELLALGERVRPLIEEMMPPTSTGGDPQDALDAAGAESVQAVEDGLPQTLPEEDGSSTTTHAHEK